MSHIVFKENTAYRSRSGRKAIVRAIFTDKMQVDYEHSGNCFIRLDGTYRLSGLKSHLDLVDYWYEKDREKCE